MQRHTMIVRWRTGAAVAAVLVLVALPFYQKAKLNADCKMAAQELDLLIGHWIAEAHPQALTEILCPPSIAAAGPATTLPANPYTKHPMRELLPGEPNRIGDFRYITRKVTYRLGGNRVQIEDVDYALAVYASQPVYQNALLPKLSRISDDNRTIIHCSDDNCWMGLDAQARTALDLRRRDAEVVAEESWDEALTRLGYP